MASIIGKKQKGKVYYYLTESARVNGKPRIVSQRYLGRGAARLRVAGRERHAGGPAAGGGGDEGGGAAAGVPSRGGRLAAHAAPAGAVAPADADPGAGGAAARCGQAADVSGGGADPLRRPRGGRRAAVARHPDAI